MNVKLIHQVARDGEKTRRTVFFPGHPNIVVPQNHIPKIRAVLFEGVTLRALKIREGFFARCAPQARHCLEIIE